MRIARWLGDLLLILCGLTVSVFAAEYISRFVRPVSPGTWVDCNGHPVDLNASTPFWPQLPPRRVVRTIAPEYDVVATIDSAGNRVPDGGTSPDVLFLGDSFTFGLGVSDRETFVWIYCNSLGLTCANLGRPGTGTIRQIETLNYYLNQGLAAARGEAVRFYDDVVPWRRKRFER